MLPLPASYGLEAVDGSQSVDWVRYMRTCVGLSPNPPPAPEPGVGPNVALVNRAFEAGRDILTLDHVRPSACLPGGPSTCLSGCWGVSVCPGLAACLPGWGVSV
jgi:hypothetical protein